MKWSDIMFVLVHGTIWIDKNLKLISKVRLFKLTQRNVFNTKTNGSISFQTSRVRVEQVLLAGGEHGHRHLQTRRIPHLHLRFGHEKKVYEKKILKTKFNYFCRNYSYDLRAWNNKKILRRWISFLNLQKFPASLQTSILEQWRLN